MADTYILGTSLYYIESFGNKKSLALGGGFTFYFLCHAACANFMLPTVNQNIIVMGPVGILPMVIRTAYMMAVIKAISPHRKLNEAERGLRLRFDLKRLAVYNALSFLTT
ncbi:MAG: hypothetical protein AAB378_03315 [Patescibacteria group bacterium]